MYQSILQPMIVDQEKQKKDRVQDNEVFLYKPHNVSSKSSRSEPKFIQYKVINLEKAMVLM